MRSAPIRMLAAPRLWDHRFERGSSIAVFVLFGLGHLVGWSPTWRSVGVTPLEPHFFDMHAVTDHAECAAKGFDAYSLNSCDPRTAFNYPPVWLLLGRLGIDGSDSGLAVCCNDRRRACGNGCNLQRPIDW